MERRWGAQEGEICNVNESDLQVGLCRQQGSWEWKTLAFLSLESMAGLTQWALITHCCLYWMHFMQGAWLPCMCGPQTLHIKTQFTSSYGVWEPGMEATVAAEGLNSMLPGFFLYGESNYLLTTLGIFRDFRFLFSCLKDGIVGNDYWSSWHYSKRRILGLPWSSISSSKNGHKKIYLTYWVVTYALTDWVLNNVWMLRRCGSWSWGDPELNDCLLAAFLTSADFLGMCPLFNQTQGVNQSSPFLAKSIIFLGW